MTANRRAGARRRALGLGLLLAGAVVAIAGHVPPAGAAPTEPDADKISVTHAGGVPVGGCISQFQLSYTIRRSGSSFQMSILAPSRPCSPIRATAVIYAMPGKGQAWPQTLQQAVPFTISEAGTTTVTFTKDCTPAQFDVVTGATPDRITPFGGVMHGPLLFPGDINTAFQDVGAVCEETTTTTTTAGATTTTAVASSTSVAGATTTVLPASTAATTSTTAKVLGTTSNRSSDPTSGVSDASLAATGASSNSTALLGGLLVAGGCIAVLVARRREDLQAHMITSAPSVSEHSPFGID